MTENTIKKSEEFEVYVSPTKPKNESNDSVQSPNYNWYNLTFKRIIDLGGAFGFMIFFGWWMFPIVAILIKLDSKGPVFFKQTRGGINGTTFNCYKFRSMVIEGKENLKQATRNDPRVTRVGKYLRTTSIDELPQVLNVIYGNMSIVGPRPLIVSQNEEYSKKIKGYENRHLVKPGITGLAQIKGYRGETVISHSIYFRYKLDMYYIKNWHPLFDIKIMLSTIKSLFQGDSNAY
ncbi:sugar transferase [Algoriphagus halophilus]|uniref:Putative colanic acid biosysnthesis UDP-glucose lipid carrier transferase n=1 Tax=Algoriphagus halophilus TaxID=226505 RepID=A0A1N6E907_9BACT|nr:sugar transferase [Algoriphagus halophilus]SIN79492.1 putative colanic acid biosysnthesis UDP-glucose lipid carrier transferase [Algoriphagus halophilus]